ncbi:MAG: transporter substrate-binding domain-containing protein [Deltaproteobacteria bacterium]|nr:transporter substrate-binding domain-containing protein [Deltaproteobacteria bacterium]
MRKAAGFLLLALALCLMPVFACVTETQVQISGSPVIDRILSRGELIVGTVGNMPPLNMITREGDIIGLEADMAAYLATSMGVKLRFETMPFSDLLPALENGKIDMILSGMTITPDRNLRVAFIGPYFVSGKSILTKIPTLDGVKDPSEINTPDTTLTTLENSTSELFVKKFIPNARLVTVKDYDQAVNLVLRNEADAMIADYPVCVVYALRHPDENLVALVSTFTYEPIGVALPKNDPLLMNWMQNTLSAIEDNGELEEMRVRWFEDDSWLSRLPPASGHPPTD